MGYVMAEEEVTQADYAALIGVSTRTVFNLRKEGLDDYVRIRGKTPMVRIPDGVQWYIRWKEQAAKDGAAPSSIEAEQLKYERLRTEKLQIEVDKLRGKSIDIELVESWVGEILARARSRLDALPMRIAQQVTAVDLVGRRKQAQDLVNEVLDELQPTPMPEEQSAGDAA